jgi:hypothetical protein
MLPYRGAWMKKRWQWWRAWLIPFVLFVPLLEPRSHCGMVVGQNYASTSCGRNRCAGTTARLFKLAT